MSHQAETRIASLLVVVVAAVGVASASEIPRTASGKPDLSGNYDIGTLTPLQRSPEFGNRLFLTPAEAEEIRRSAAERTAQGSRPSDPNRPPPPFTGRLGGYNEFFHDRGTEAVAVDGKYRTSLLTDPPDGRLPPLTERGRERRKGLYVRRNLADRNASPAWWRDLQAGPYDGPESLSIADRCIFTLEATIPVLPKNYNNLKTIVQTESHVMILIEWMHEARVIRISPSRAEARHLPPEIRSRSGDSVGWWEGDTLVVDTTNFLEESWGTVTLFGEPSPPHDQHVVERFSLTDENTLLYEFTVKSGDWETPYSGEYTWPATNDKLYEFACHEANYSMGNTLRGARFQEREVAAEAGAGP
ncbi:MAG: hypothetical protein OXI49_18515 [Acidobacteriota bacterium]|nr:hypothetical protein [Acidobacteriota bacterium]